MAASASQVNDANIAAEAIRIAQQTIATADKKIANDCERLAVINRALNASTTSPDDLQVVLDTQLSSRTGQTWPGTQNPGDRLTNPLTAQIEADRQANLILQLAIAADGGSDPTVPALRYDAFTDLDSAVGNRYKRDPEFRKQMDAQLDAASERISRERDHAIAVAEDERFANLRKEVDKMESEGLLKKGVPLPEQEKDNPTVHERMDAVRAKERVAEAPKIEHASAAAIEELHNEFLMLGNEHRLESDLWVKSHPSDGSEPK
jgi:hypothetical protein